MRKVAVQVGTYNIYNTTARYQEGRREFLLQTIKELPVDVLGLQEVAEEQLPLFYETGWSEVLFAPLEQSMITDEDPTFRIDGNAILLRKQWNVVPGSHETLKLAKDRLAQRALISNGSVEILVVNTHLHWAVNALGVATRFDAKIRQTQMEDVLEWLNEYRSVTTVLLGDLNVFFPDEKIPILLQAAGFESAYRKVHGFDPLTANTPLEAPSIRPGSCVEMSCDFVLLRMGSALRAKVIDVVLAGNNHKQGDSTLYPSDHYAVCATVEFDKVSNL